MIYRFVWFLVQIATRVFFRRIFIHFEEKIPKNKPVILACNHPNSFLDDLLIGSILQRQLFFLPRGDAFNKYTSWILLKLHMIPIYRMQEGRENLKKNEQTFDKIIKLLEQRKTIMIHSEGVCIIEKKLRRLKKGTARIAFDTEIKNDFNANLQVVPVGLNYTYPTKFRKEAMIEFGKPFTLNQFKDTYLKNNSAGLNQFNALLTQELDKRIITVNNDEKWVTESMFALVRNNLIYTFFKTIIKQKKRFELEKSISTKIKLLFDNDKERFVSLKSKIVDYFKLLKKNNISDRSISDVKPAIFWHLLFLILFLPFFIIGYCINFLPVLLIKKIEKSTVRSNVFRASVLYGSGIVLYLILSLILFLVAGIIFSWYGILAVVGILIVCYLQNYYLESFDILSNFINLIQLKRKNKSLYLALKKKREEILNLT